jgi:hypothetical protein
LIKRHQQLPRRLLHVSAKKFAKPFFEFPTIGVMGARISGKIWKLIFSVVKGMEPRILFDPKVGSAPRGMVEPDGRVEFKGVTGRFEIDKSYTISEDVVYPPHVDWLGRYFQLAIQQTLIETVSRAKHQLVCAEPYRLAVSIGRRVMDDEDSHQLCLTLAFAFSANLMDGATKAGR